MAEVGGVSFYFLKISRSDGIDSCMATVHAEQATINLVSYSQIGTMWGRLRPFINDN